MQCETIYEEWPSSRLALEEAAELLGVDERSLRVGRARYEVDGLGLSEPRWSRAIPVSEMMELQDLN